MEHKQESKECEIAQSHGISRRDFIAHAALVGAGLTTGAAWAAAQKEPTKKTPSDEKTSSKLGNERRKLDPLEVSGLGLGCMNVAWGEE